MTKFINGVFLLVMLVSLMSCSDSVHSVELRGKEHTESQLKDIDDESILDSIMDSPVSISNYVPEGYVVFDSLAGDLNNDGIIDSVLIVKSTDKNQLFHDEYRGELDRNRRGIMIFMSSNGKLELLIENLDCFSSENEDGGVYFAPDLDLAINKANLYVEYGHGRYGHWKYTFRIKENNFELIGYDLSDNYGPIIKRETSINYLTKRKLERVNLNQDEEEIGNEIFEDTWTDISVSELIKLSEIKNFDELKLPGMD